MIGKVEAREGETGGRHRHVERQARGDDEALQGDRGKGGADHGRWVGGAGGGGVGAKCVALTILISIGVATERGDGL